MCVGFDDHLQLFPSAKYASYGKGFYWWKKSFKVVWSPCPSEAGSEEAVIGSNLISRLQKCITTAILGQWKIYYWWNAGPIYVWKISHFQDIWFDRLWTLPHWLYSPLQMNQMSMWVPIVQNKFKDVRRRLGSDLMPSFLFPPLCYWLHLPLTLMHAQAQGFSRIPCLEEVRVKPLQQPERCARGSMS